MEFTKIGFEIFPKTHFGNTNIVVGSDKKFKYCTQSYKHFEKTTREAV